MLDYKSPLICTISSLLILQPAHRHGSVLILAHNAPLSLVEQYTMSSLLRCLTSAIATAISVSSRTYKRTQSPSAVLYPHVPTACTI